MFVAHANMYTNARCLGHAVPSEGVFVFDVDQTQTPQIHKERSMQQQKTHTQFAHRAKHTNRARRPRRQVAGCNQEKQTNLFGQTGQMILKTIAGDRSMPKRSIHVSCTIQERRQGVD